MTFVTREGFMVREELMVLLANRTEPCNDSLYGRFATSLSQPTNTRLYQSKLRRGVEFLGGGYVIRGAAIAELLDGV